MRSDLPQIQKDFLIKQLIQLGIDFYNLYQNRPTDGGANALLMWNNGAGQANGYMPIILIAGYLLNSPLLLAQPAAGNEAVQYFKVQETPPGSGIANNGYGCYESCYSRPFPLKHAVIGWPEWGPNHYKTIPAGSQAGQLQIFENFDDCGPWPTISIPGPCMGMECTISSVGQQSKGYRICCTAPVQWGEALAIIAMTNSVPTLRETWNSKLPSQNADVWFHYLDRYDLAEPNNINSWEYYKWPYDMWRVNRASLSMPPLYPTVWTPP